MIIPIFIPWFIERERVVEKSSVSAEEEEARFFRETERDRREMEAATVRLRLRPRGRYSV